MVSSDTLSLAEDVTRDQDKTRDQDMVAKMAARDGSDRGRGGVGACVGVGGEGGHGEAPRRRLSKNPGWMPIAQHGSGFRV